MVSSRRAGQVIDRAIIAGSGYMAENVCAPNGRDRHLVVSQLKQNVLDLPRTSMGTFAYSSPALAVMSALRRPRHDKGERAYATQPDAGGSLCHDRHRRPGGLQQQR
jgi:hypothetical protein